MADTFWDNFVDASRAFGGRLVEETGISDVVEELARFVDDPSVLNFGKAALGAAWQAKDIPFQSAFAVDVEANRYLGAQALANSKMAKAGDWSFLLSPAAAVLKGPDVTQPYMNYLTGGATDEEREVAPGIYKAPMLSDLLLITADISNRKGLPWIEGIPVAGAWADIAYQAGRGGEGPYENGSLVPPAFDIYAPDVGEQLEEGGAGTARMLYAAGTEALISPLNLIVPVGASAMAARHTRRLVAFRGITNAADVEGAAANALVANRAARTPTGFGLWSQQRMIQEMTEHPEVIEALAKNKDVNWARNFFKTRWLAHGEAADELARLSTALDDPADIIRLFDAGAYRNAESIRIIGEAIDDDIPLSEAFKSFTNTGDNIIDATRVDFPDGSILPDGHILRLGAKQYLDQALEMNPGARKAWDAMADEVKAGWLARTEERRAAAMAYDKAFAEGRADQLLEALPKPGRQTAKHLDRTDWLTTGSTKVHVLPGDGRFRPKFLLMAKPGLTFRLHGIDAVDRLDDWITYANRVIGVGDGAPKGFMRNRLAKGYEFANDPEVMRIRAAFIDAGATTKAPEQIRAQLVNELQTMMLAKLGESCGFAPEIAQTIAAAGMNKSGTILSAMMRGENGYMTIVMENGVPQILVQHPGTIRQTANFIPIMDLAGVRKAMKSPMMRGLLHDHSLMSVSFEEASEVISAYRPMLENSRRGLEKFGRVGAFTRKNPAAGLAQTVYHQIVDILDVANSMFKIGVLLRLGYPVRNISEGLLSVHGSGVGLAEVLAAADLPGLWSNAVHNLGKAFPRASDRVHTWLGLRKNETLLTEALRREIQNRDLSWDQIRRLVDTLTEDATYRQLVETIVDPKASPEALEAAYDALEHIVTMKNRLAIAVRNDMVAEGTAWADDVKVAQRLYRADPHGTFAGTKASTYGDDVWELPEGLERPLSMTPYADIAKAHIDDSFDYIRAADDGTPGWATRPIVDEFDPGEKFWLGRAGAPDPAGAGLPQRQIDALTMPTDRASEIGAQRAAMKQVAIDAEPGTHIWRGEAVTGNPLDPTDVGIHWTADPNWVITHGQHSLAEGQHDVVWHAVIKGDEKRTAAYGIGREHSALDGEAEVRFATGSDVHIVGVSVDGTYYPIEKTVKTRKATTETGVVPAMADDAKNFKAPPKRAAVKAPAPKNSAYAQWHEQQQALKELSKTHSIEYRTGPDEPWQALRFYGGKDRKYIPGVSEKWEFRTIPKEMVNSPSAQKVYGVDTWGRQVDFREPGSYDYALENFTDLNPEALDAAIGGDRAAQERISNILAKHKVYRTVWADSEAWGNVNVLVHPKGIGGRGLRDAVLDEMDSITKRIADDIGPMAEKEAFPTVKGSKDVAMLNRGIGLKARFGTPVHPKYATTKVDILKNGGFDSIVDEAITQHVQILRRLDALKTAYQSRMAKVGSMAKRRGIRDRIEYFASDYGGAYMTNDLLHGLNGSSYGQLTSADLTNATTFGGTQYRADLLNDVRTSYLKPTVIDSSDPYYFEALSNLLGRYYRDAPGAEDLAKRFGIVTTMDIDPIVLRALQPGDRDWLVREAVDWALHDPAGQDWVRSMDLLVPERGGVPEAMRLGQEARARRLAKSSTEYKGRAEARKVRRENQAVPWGEGTPHEMKVSEVNVEDVIHEQFNFVENFMLKNPRIRDAFLSGRSSADELRAIYEAEPWELLPFHGALSPTSAEYRAMMAASVGTLNDVHKISNIVLRGMGNALRGIGSVPENRLLRHPTFLAIAKSDLQQRVAHAERMFNRSLTFDEFNDLRGRAQQFALVKLKDTLYTLESRSTLDDYLRFVSPFFPAWINALSRWGKFFMRNPANPMRMYSRMSSITRSQSDITKASPLIVDENGEPQEDTDIKGFDQYMILPVGAGMLPKVRDIPGAAEAMNRTRIPLRSIDVIFQGDMLNPGFGPLVTMPLQGLLTARDDWFQDKTSLGAQVINKIMPVGPVTTGNKTMDAILQWMPTSVRRTLDRYVRNSAWLSTYNRMYLTLLESGDYEDSEDGFIRLRKDAERLTNTFQTIKIGAAVLAPLSNQQQGDFEYYSGQYREIRDKHSGDVQVADEEFLARFPEKWLLSQSSTINLTGGSSTAWTTRNQGRYTDAQRLAAVLGDPSLLSFTDNLRPDGTIGTTVTDDFNVYSRRAQMYSSPQGFSEPYRKPGEAEEVVRKARIDEGWVRYGQIEDAVVGKLVAAGFQIGSYDMLKVKQEAMSKVADVIGQTNPEWAQERGTFNANQKETNATFFRMLLNEPQWMSDYGDQGFVDDMKIYLTARERVRQIIELRVAEANAKDEQWGQSTTARDNEDLAAYLAWEKERLAYDSPTFKWWADRYFRNDVVSLDAVEMGGF